MCLRHSSRRGSSLFLARVELVLTRLSTGISVRVEPGVAQVQKSGRTVRADSEGRRLLPRARFDFSGGCGTDKIRRVRILVADDNVAVRELLVDILEGAGFEVTQAGDGAETLSSFRERPADLLLCDIFMPAKDGLEIIQTLRSQHPKLKIIAISGDPSALDMLRVARFLGAAEVIRKPIDVVELVTTVRRVLGVAG